MSTLDQVPVENDSTHLLLIGQTKTGKSTYIAQAAIDGHTIIYVDSDNGLSALRRSLNKLPEPQRLEVMQRIIYFRTEKPYSFINSMFSQGVFRWNSTQDSEFSSFRAAPEDKIVEMIPSKIPRKVIIVADSWTTIALDAMDDVTGGKTLADLEQAQKQGAYGDSGIKLTILCAIIQQMKQHVIVLAHPTRYEILEKPAGKLGQVKQGEMILKETWEIPASVSRPHGFGMGKYFTDIGWLEISRADQRMIDYRVHHNRIAGGTIAEYDSVDNLTFTKTFAIPSKEPLINSNWIRFMTAEEFTAATAASKGQGPLAGKSSDSLPKTPAKPTVSALMKK